MLTLNEVTIAGYLGRDPEIRTTQNGDNVANLSVATVERWKDNSGQRQERTDWHRVVVWGPLVAIVQQYTRKGSSALFRGQLRTRKWTDQQGNDRYVTEVYCSGPRAMVLLNDPPTGHQQPQAGPAQQPQGGYQQPQQGQQAQAPQYPGAGPQQPAQGQQGSPYGGGQPQGNLDDEIPF